MYKIPLAGCLALLALLPSPDPRIAFATRAHDVWEIFVMNDDGAERRQITRGGGQVRFPLWSPDRARLAFGLQLASDWQWELWVMDADGGNRKRLVPGIVGKGTRSWSPDGASIALAAQVNGDTEILTVRPADGRIARLTSTAGEDRDPAWAPDGQYIAFSSVRAGNAELYLMRADGSGVRRLTHNTVRDGSPAWSPDGSRIAFVSGAEGERDMYAVRLSDGTIERLTTGARVTNDVAKWSPDGKLLAIQVNNSSYDIELVTGAGERRAIVRSPGFDGQFTWSPDSRRLAYVADGQGAPGLYVVDVSTGLSRRLAAGQVLNPAWAN